MKHNGPKFLLQFTNHKYSANANKFLTAFNSPRYDTQLLTSDYYISINVRDLIDKADDLNKPQTVKYRAKLLKAFQTAFQPIKDNIPTKAEVEGVQDPRFKHVLEEFRNFETAFDAAFDNYVALSATTDRIILTGMQDAFRFLKNWESETSKDTFRFYHYMRDKPNTTISFIEFLLESMHISELWTNRKLVLDLLSSNTSVGYTVSRLLRFDPSSTSN